jgi:hypothetical protein
MLLRHSRLIVTAFAMLLSLAPAAHAVVLWDQSNWNPNGEGSLNLSSTSCSQISGNTKLHTANDVHFDGPVHITTVRIYESPGNVEAATQAHLWIAPKTGALPTQCSADVNNAGNIVPITISYETINNVTTVIVTASGLNIDLPPGDYWVSLTPRHSRGGTFPWTVHRVTTGPIIGDPTPSIEACVANCNWIFVLAPTMYDYAIKIEGDLPVPALQESWGKVKTLYR